VCVCVCVMFSALWRDPAGNRDELQPPPPPSASYRATTEQLQDPHHQGITFNVTRGVIEGSVTVTAVHCLHSGAYFHTRNNKKGCLFRSNIALVYVSDMFLRSRLTSGTKKISLPLSRFLISKFQLEAKFSIMSEKSLNFTQNHLEHY